MKELEELASEFVINYGNELRALPYAELFTDNATQEGEITIIKTPPELEPYTFVTSRCNYDNGIIRVYAEGEKSGTFINTRFKDAFDIYPNGDVKEIALNDEDWCGRT